MALTFTYSGNVYGTGSAGQTTFPLVSTAGNNIPYLLPAHIHAYFSTDNQQTWNELARPGEWDFSDTGTAVVLAAPLPAATELLIRRITPPLDPFVNFQPSSLLTAEQLNEAERFSLYLDQELKDAVDIDSAGSLIYKGLIDLTADNAPLAPQVGWTYYNTGAGTVIQGGTPGWVGITGDAVLGGEQVIYDGTNWTIPDPVFGVQQVTGTAPITVDNTDGQRPVVGITAATTSAAGSMSGADKTKLDGIASGAEVNVQSDWNEANTGSDAFIQNKPTIPDPTNPPASGTFGYWSRTGTVVAPATSTDDINTLGDIAAGGSLGGASLNVNGLEYASVDGTAGQLLTTDGAGTLGWSTVDPPPGTVISDIAPANPEEGQLWWDSVGGQLYVWYEDANSSQWVQANGGGGGGGGDPFPPQIDVDPTAPEPSMTIDAAGRLLVGTATPANSGFWAPTALVQVQGASGSASGTGVIALRRGGVPTATGQGLGTLVFSDTDGLPYADIRGEVDGTPSGTSTPGRLNFFTTPSGSTTSVERMRVSNAGTIFTHGSDSQTLVLTNTRAANATDRLIWGLHGSTAIGNGSPSFQVTTNGDVQNTNNSYGALSDIKLKENIVDAKSQWADIKGLRLVNYNFKPETGAETHKQLGLIAQEVEQVCPGLVGETKDTDADGNETGEVTKNVAYSVLYMKAVGALQEAMQRIEQLETTNASLEARLTALEGN